MKTTQKLIIWALLTLSPALSFAKSVAVVPTVLPVPNTTQTESSKMDPNRVMPPVDNQKTYIFDQDATKKLAESKSSLIKVNCDGLQVLKDLWFTQNTSNMFSIGVSEWGFDYNFDLRNCSLWGSKTNQQYTGKPLTEAQALSAAKLFMWSKYLTQKVFSKYWAPIVIAKNSNGPRPMYKDAISSTSAVMDGIDIDPTDTGDINPEYISFSILFPYVLNGRAIYNNYGNRAGISLEVNSEWVTSINAQLLPFKWAARNADKMSADDMSTYIKKWWNNQYRGQETKINLGKPEQILVLFSLRRNNVTELYISSGIKFSTNLKPDQRTQQPYEMTLSDYKVGNNNYGY